MQLIPLTGTETGVILASRESAADATHTPHGDGNRRRRPILHRLADATHTPHGDGNNYRNCAEYYAHDATHTPHGDGNRELIMSFLALL